MTLATHIYLQEDVNIEELFERGQLFLQQYDEEHRPPSAQRSNKGPSKWSKSGVWNIGNELGQGLPGILDLDYKPGSMLVTSEESAAHDEDCNYPGNKYYDDAAEECDGAWHNPVAWAELSLDTAYGYKGPNGISCSQLHALLLFYLDELGYKFLWKNEYTGEISNQLEGIDNFIGSGESAMDWFNTVVKPFIQSEIENHD